MIALAFGTALHAQELAPELASLAAKYKADTAAIEGQRKTEASRLANVYGAALDAAEKAETSAGHVNTVAAITRERDSVKKDEVISTFPNDLPKGLRTARKGYLDGIERVVNELGQRQQRINADYLRALAAFQQRVGSNEQITKQIAEEKERVFRANLVGSNPNVVGLWQLRNLGNNDTIQIEFKPEGTFVDAAGKRWGTWEVKGKQLVSSWETQALSDRFDLPVRDGKLTGKNNKGSSLVLTRKSP